jgi:hypothetical protein
MSRVATALSVLVAVGWLVGFILNLTYSSPGYGASVGAAILTEVALAALVFIWVLHALAAIAGPPVKRFLARHRAIRPTEAP